jgi:hypothetical protein
LLDAVARQALRALRDPDTAPKHVAQACMILTEPTFDANSFNSVRRQFDDYDSNGDGILDRKEWLGPMSEFSAADTSRDDRITMSELAGH